jgi:rhodanese-related sulfurtransferase
MNADYSKLPLEISCADVRRKLDDGDDFLFVDCREADEYALVHLDSARLFPMSEMALRIGELEPHRDCEIVIHCHHGGRSLQVAAWLRGQGFAHASSMAGGIDQWALEIDSSLPRY